MIGNVSGVSKDDINAGLNSNGAGLGDYSIEISVDVATGGGAGCHTPMMAKTSIIRLNS